MASSGTHRDTNEGHVNVSKCCRRKNMLVLASHVVDSFIQELFHFVVETHNRVSQMSFVTREMIKLINKISAIEC